MEQIRNLREPRKLAVATGACIHQTCNAGAAQFAKEVLGGGLREPNGVKSHGDRCVKSFGFVCAFARRVVAIRFRSAAQTASRTSITEPRSASES